MPIEDGRAYLIITVH